MWIVDLLHHRILRDYEIGENSQCVNASYIQSAYASHFIFHIFMNDCRISSSFPSFEWIFHDTLLTLNKVTIDWFKVYKTFL